MSFVSGLIPPDEDLFWIFKFGGIDHDIFGKIDQNRPWSSASGDIEGFFEDPGQIFDIFHQVIMFGAGPGDADNVDFLEGVVSDQERRDLAGQDDDGDGVHEGGGNPCDRIGSTGPGGDQSHSRLSRGSRVSVCSMDGGLFMADQHLMEWGTLKFIKKREYRPTRIIKDNIHPFLFQTFDNDLRTGLFHDGSMSNVKAQISNEIQMAKCQRENSKSSTI